MKQVQNVMPAREEVLEIKEPAPALPGGGNQHRRTRSRHTRTSSTLAGGEAGGWCIRAVEPMMQRAWEVDEQAGRGIEMPVFGEVMVNAMGGMNGTGGDPGVRDTELVSPMAPERPEWLFRADVARAE